MEHRTYIPNNRPNQDTMTRIQQDLSSSPHQESYLEANGDPLMIRRAVGRIPHICVVGAGVAGLRCADILLQHGVKVTILEGRDRVGGRRSDTWLICRFAESIVCFDYYVKCKTKSSLERGPNWIHGTESNPILDLAKQTNTMTMTWDERQSVFDHLGNQMSEEKAAEGTELVWTIIGEAMKHSNEDSATIPVDKSLYNFFEEKVDKMFPAMVEGDSEAKRKKETILQMAEMWGAFVGSPIQTQSLRFFWLEECIDGENLFVAETYHKVLAKIAEPALEGAEIKFAQKVKKICSNEVGQDPSVSVEIEGGESLTFDEVVMTTPLGWLKRNNDSFVPELPNRLKQAIDCIGYGNLDKAYITFPTPFWNTSSPAGNGSIAIPHQQSIPNVTATTAPLHQSSEPTTVPQHYPGFTHWTSPHYTETNPSHWNQECVNLAALPESTAHPTLLFYTFGPTSLHLASLLRKFSSPSSPAAQTILSNFFHPYFSRLPNYDPLNPDHQPFAILATVWANDELAGYGSYSNFQTGLEHGDQDIEIMRRGLPERGIWFAGEHTAPFVALGTVTGAYWAGEGVAKRIVRAFGLEEKGEGNEDENEDVMGNGAK
ncbi:amine oxidase [Melanomma pulvis-pyrius CBS 109.77]|uniref:Amine oxidase n=1 Tax=Melanomma pulvis-pyrius CBS 109.77 TaxID=1314802 RepID=A0A6A6X7K7_9PLEO|nr:amine oxidase [Melanomma pulvis-pyrius CBS 109.77]